MKIDIIVGKEKSDIMKAHKYIKLNPYEITSYWWINLIKHKVRELVIWGTRNKDEAQFVTIFFEYTEKDWRSLYLALAKYIEKDVENHIPKYPSDFFSQDTDKNSHDRLNEELSCIIGKRIPDIRIASNNVKDSVIYTTTSNASTWYKSCGVLQLPNEYMPSYILTGDDKSLDFYYLFLATVATVYKREKSFHSTTLLRERFCKEFVRLSGETEDITNIMELFDHCFNAANHKGIITGRFYDSTYFASLKDIDYIGLEPFMELASHYADVILQKEKEDGMTLEKIPPKTES